MSPDKRDGKTKEERDAQALREKQARDHEIRIRELQLLLKERSFRRHTWRQINFCGVYRCSREQNSSVYFDNGMRWVGLEILNDVNEADPTVEGLMRKECTEDMASAG